MTLIANALKKGRRAAPAARWCLGGEIDPVQFAFLDDEGVEEKWRVIIMPMRLRENRKSC
jgi:hypothetical protein